MKVHHYYQKTINNISNESFCQVREPTRTYINNVNLKEVLHQKNGGRKESVHGDAAGRKEHHLIY